MLALAIAFTGIASAAANELDAFYSSSWAGLPAGDIKLGLASGQDAYQSRLEVETRGLPHWFTHFHATVANRGHLTDGTAAPQHYEAHFDLRKRKNRLISFTFAPEAGATQAGATQAERDAGDTSTKAELAANFRRNVLDPLSALVSMRQWLAAKPRQPGETFLLPVYDGARRFDVQGEMLPDADKDGLVHLKLMLKPIAGFKGESSDEGDPDSAPRPLQLSLTSDKFLPVRMRVLIAWLPFVVYLDRTCDDFEHCTAAASKG